MTGYTETAEKLLAEMIPEQVNYVLAHMLASIRELEHDAIIRDGAVRAEQRKRDAEICRQIHSTSRQRVELALLCARKIEASDHTHP